MLEYIGGKIGKFLRITVGTYAIFCIVMWAYFMIVLHEIPNDCSFIHISANIGFLLLLLILILLMICT